MGSTVFPAPSSGGIKLVQRGSAAGAGSVTITAVNITKAFVNIFGTTSSGTVAASGTINAATGNAGAATMTFNAPHPFYSNYTGGIYTNSTTNNSNTVGAHSISLNSTSLTGGSNNLVAAVVQGYLSDSTTLVVSGACRWEVVEFN